MFAKRSMSLCAVLLLLGCAEAPNGITSRPNFSQGGGPGSSATGNAHVHLQFEGATFAERFSFNAINQPNGDVAGNFELFTDQLDGIRLHGSVTCLGVAGNVGRIGGVIEQADPPDFAGLPLVGLSVVWTVVDNGEGSQAAPDQTSDIVFASPTAAQIHCARGFALPLLEDEQGNIQVHP